jgi:hypothetical protein
MLADSILVKPTSSIWLFSGKNRMNVDVTKTELFGLFKAYLRVVKEARLLKKNVSHDSVNF